MDTEPVSFHADPVNDGTEGRVHLMYFNVTVAREMKYALTLP